MATRSNISSVTSLAKQLAQNQLTSGEPREFDQQELTLIEQVNILLREKARGNAEIQTLVQQVDELIKQKKT
jgi:hypothetical protein